MATEKYKNTLEALEDQLHTVVHGEWLRDAPSDDNQGCLVIRARALTQDEIEQFYARESMKDVPENEREDYLLDEYEMLDNGKPGTTEQLPPAALRHVNRAIKMLFPTAWGTISHGSVADGYPSTAISFNDHHAGGKEDVIAVLRQAIKTARAQIKPPKEKKQ